MNVSRIALTDFRNYENAEYLPGPGVNVLVGDNAQGKTNLLEALRLCSVGRSHRTARDRELVREDANSATVRVEWTKRDGPHELCASIPTIGTKQIRIDSKALRRSGELMGMLPSVMFAPEDLYLVKNGPAERRRFIDMELSQLRASYYYSLQRYQRALKQRNNLLRGLESTPALRDTLPGWNEVLASEGAEIIRQRLDYVERLNEVAGECHGHISGRREELRVEYDTQPERASVNDMAAQLLKRLETSAEYDIRRGGTSIGPHRDDLLLTLDGRDARVYASQGQQRTVALSLKLSELGILRDETEECPLLMLDDVMSELDPERRRKLLTRIEGVQTLVTCTDASDLAGASFSTITRVAQGQLAPDCAPTKPL